LGGNHVCNLLGGKAILTFDFVAVVLFGGDSRSSPIYALILSLTGLTLLPVDSMLPHIFVVKHDGIAFYASVYAVLRLVVRRGQRYPRPGN
jgi:hypothetical protein